MTENTSTKTATVANTEDRLTITIDKKKFKKIAIITGTALAAVGTVAFLTNVSASLEGELSLDPATDESENESSTTE